MSDKPILLDPSLDKQLKGHRGAITALYFNPNEQQIASSSLDNSVLLWDLGGTLRSYRFRGHDEAVTDVTFSPSGKYMASASRDKTVRLWVPTVTGSTGVFKAHSQTVRSVQFSPDGSKIITASDDKIVKMWSSDKFKFISSFIGHTNWVRCARMSNDGSVIASCSDDKSTRLWNPDSGEMIHSYKDQKGHSMSLAWHPSGCYIAIGTTQGNIKLYDIRTHNLVQYYSIHNDAVTQLAFHPSGSYILTASKDEKMKILDLLEGHPIFTLSGHTGAVNAVHFSPSGESFASAGEDKLVNLWRTNFTELAHDAKENVSENPANMPKSVSHVSKSSSSKGRNQGIRSWYLCYHTAKYPVTTFVHFDEVPEYIDEMPKSCLVQQESVMLPSCFNQPDANSTLLGTYHSEISDRSKDGSMTESSFLKCGSKCPSNPANTFSMSGSGPANASSQRNSSLRHWDCQSKDCSSNSVGHSSHIPRSSAPKPSTYTLPSIVSKSVAFDSPDEDLFGMIKLKQNDICYTNGTIEWVGRKRSFPINSGFKTMNEFHGLLNEPIKKKLKKLDRTFSNTTFNCDSKMRECDCIEMLPTVNAIVDHLNALHEAVDIVDLRLHTLEGAMSKDE